MKCPRIKEECWGEDCVIWSKDKGKCYEQLQYEAYAQMFDMMPQYYEMMGFYQLLWKLSLADLMRNPSIPDEVKEGLQKAKDVQTAEKLLKDAGLI